MGTRDWFEQLTGFREENYELTQSRLTVVGDQLISAVNQKRYGIGHLTMPTVAELRARVDLPEGPRSTVRCVAADVAALHSAPEFENALFQVASQFNLLEMISPNVSPEDGVARYTGDHTQGPACAVAAGAATIYRNYCVPIDGQVGQTTDRFLDALAEVGSSLSQYLDMPLQELWIMRNGYALCTPRGLQSITELISDNDDIRQTLLAKLAIGVHSAVEVTRVQGDSPHVSQAFCSALPVAYSPIPSSDWEPFARLVLEAAYEATLLAAVETPETNTVLLTRLGGNAFGNDDRWIDDAIVRSLGIIEHAGLDVVLVSYGSVHPSMQRIADDWG